MNLQVVPYVQLDQVAQVAELNEQCARLILKDPVKIPPTFSNPRNRSQREPIPPNINAVARGIRVLSQLSTCPHVASCAVIHAKQQHSAT